jgi:DNA-binding NarL/FixJ family response regulator
VPEVTVEKPEHDMTQEENNQLSTREKAIIRLVAQAKARKTIAAELKVSIHTVDTHLRHIHLKTNTHSLSELVLWAMNRRRDHFLPTYK